jgi:predicted hydrocarbon binding protein
MACLDVFHPVACDYYADFFKRITENSIKSQNVKVEETKCLYRGNPHHEHSVSW